MGDELYSLQVWIEYCQGSGYNEFHSDAGGASSASPGVQKGQVRRGPLARDTQQDGPAVLRAQPYRGEVGDGHGRRSTLPAAPSNPLGLG